MNASDLSSSLNGWIHFAELGCVVVIIGIIGEGVDLLSKWWKKREFRVGFGIRFEEMNRGRATILIKRARPRILEIETISLALVATGLLIEVWASHEVYAISDLQNVKIKAEAGAAIASASRSESNSANVLWQVAELNKEAGDARKDAGSAKESASKLDAARALAEKETALIRSNNLELQIKLQPRIITEQQITNFIFLTEKIPKILVRISTGPIRDEVISYAIQIQSMLAKAGYKIPDSDTNMPLGIHMDETAIIYYPDQKDYKKPWPDVDLMVDITNDYTRISFNTELTNRFVRPIVSENDTNRTYAALYFVLNEIKIIPDWTVKPDWVSPNHCAIFVCQKPQ
jgi:hypothetical protein